MVKMMDRKWELSGPVNRCSSGHCYKDPRWGGIWFCLGLEHPTCLLASGEREDPTLAVSAELSFHCQKINLFLALTMVKSFQGVTDKVRSASACSQLQCLCYCSRPS